MGNTKDATTCSEYKEGGPGEKIVGRVSRDIGYCLLPLNEEEQIDFLNLSDKEQHLWPSEKMDCLADWKKCNTKGSKTIASFEDGIEDCVMSVFNDLDVKQYTPHFGRIVETTGITLGLKPNANFDPNSCTSVVSNTCTARASSEIPRLLMSFPTSTPYFAMSSSDIITNATLPTFSNFELPMIEIALPRT